MAKGRKPSEAAKKGEWRLPNGETIKLGKPTIKLGQPKPRGYYGRQARWDCCTDCGKQVAMGELWCAKCRPMHRDKRSLEAEAGHRRTLMADRTLVKPW